MSTMGRWVALAIVLVLVVAGVMVLLKNRGGVAKEVLPYEFVDASDGTIRRIATDLGPVTRIKFTPDGKYMLVGLLQGEVHAFLRDPEGEWVKQEGPIVTVKTSFPGFPPEENGLTGMALAADYATSGEIFLTYAAQAGEGDFRNRVARATLTDADGKLTGSEATDIFEANAKTSSSHQIQAINGILVEGTSHAIFQLGEGFQAARANDLTQEAGKVMLIQRDGKDPLGPRPFKNQPKIQAIGLRNPPEMTINELDPEKRIGIADTGAGKNDRFIYAKLIDLVNGKAVKGLEFGWAGNDVPDLADKRPDPNVAGNTDSVVYRWDPTHTATNLVFHPGKGAIPTSTNDQTSVLVSLFGPTGEAGFNEDGTKKVGREIWLGNLKLGTNPSVTWEPFIVRSEAFIAELGHPIGLERDPQTNDLIFADILEGALYSGELAE